MEILRKLCKFLLFLLCIIFVFTNCRSGPVTYIHPTIDFSYVKRVALLPLENYTDDKYAGDKVGKVFISELLSTGAFEIVEPGEVMKALVDNGIQSVANISNDKIISIGKALKCQSLILGAVEEYGEIRGGSQPDSIVSVTFRMVESETAEIIWSVSHTKDGINFATRMFGTSGGTISEITRRVVRESIDTLF